jgi:hypothetical protein
VGIAALHILFLEQADDPFPDQRTRNGSCAAKQHGDYQNGRYQCNPDGQSLAPGLHRDLFGRCIGLRKLGFQPVLEIRTQGRRIIVPQKFDLPDLRRFTQGLPKKFFFLQFI